MEDKINFCCYWLWFYKFCLFVFFLFFWKSCYAGLWIKSQTELWSQIVITLFVFQKSKVFQQVLFLERVLILRNFIREISSHSEIKSKIQFLETWSNKAWQPQKVKFIKKEREKMNCTLINHSIIKEVIYIFWLTLVSLFSPR